MFRDGFDRGFDAITPATVRDALAREEKLPTGTTRFDDHGNETLHPTPEREPRTLIIAAFETIRASLDPDDVLRRMRDARLAEEDAEGLDRCVGAIRAMIAGGFVEGDASRGEPLADALFRWSACAVRAWKLNRRRAELARELDAALEDAAAAANRGEEEKTTPTRARRKNNRSSCARGNRRRTRDEARGWARETAEAGRADEWRGVGYAARRRVRVEA